MMMNLTAALLLLHYCAAFAPASLQPRPAAAVSSSQLFAVQASTGKTKGGSAAELGIPCEDECALESFPNLPESVHPGVLSGQAQVDLLNHAKENGM